MVEILILHLKSKEQLYKLKNELFALNYKQEENNNENKIAIINSNTKTFFYIEKNNLETFKKELINKNQIFVEVLPSKKLEEINFIK